jgi:hypothetical protein
MLKNVFLPLEHFASKTLTITRTNGISNLFTVAGKVAIRLIAICKSMDAQVTNESLFLNGSGYASGTGTGIFNTATTVIKTRFKPYFPIVTAGPFFFLMYASNGGRYTIYIPAGNSMIINLGNTPVFTISYATWSAAWNNYDWNEMTITAVEAGGAGSTVVLNGVTIAATGAAFTKDNPAVLYVGCRYDATGKFKGEIDYIRIYSDAGMTTLTANYEFNGDYTSGVSSTNDLSEQGSGNSFSCIISLGLQTPLTGFITDTEASSLLANEIWFDTTPDTTIDTLDNALLSYVINGASIFANTTGGINSAQIAFYCFWTPLSVGASVTPT